VMAAARARASSTVRLATVRLGMSFRSVGGQGSPAISYLQLAIYI
jgi:hypothetical protein